MWLLVFYLSLVLLLLIPSFFPSSSDFIFFFSLSLLSFPFHPSGHGVGNYLTCHEQGSTFYRNDPLLPREIITIEPGLYLTNHFGVRIESLGLVSRDAGTLPSFFAPVDIPPDSIPTTPDTQYYGFETVTLVPYQRSLSDPTMLLEPEKKWLNQFNARCRRMLLPFLTPEETDWLVRETEQF